ncbi:hypothetical protein [Allostreptomyces psammosilenae]|uniref:Uncharacterized protein n=1 Tax=Allostreptomyces psammosilenae TaxID=1892865 RepID=A0A853A083_9ACTN|nr:hypothetical protein [Allostreptomyces psammosilenae]NYI07799.1 hypothetical protein [Allostreptomyces psammosilenae]
MLDIRVRIERLAVRAFTLACEPPGYVRSEPVADRLAFVLAAVPPDRWEDAVGTVRLVRHVYRKASDILHGRSNMMNVPDTIIEEWRAAVEELERLLPE